MLILAQSVTPPVDVAAFVNGLVAQLGPVLLAVVVGYMGLLAVTISIRKAKRVDPGASGREELSINQINQIRRNGNTVITGQRLKGGKFEAYVE